MANLPAVQIQGSGSSGMVFDIIMNVLMDLAAATGIYQSVRGEIKNHEASKVYTELEKLARILMDDTSRANEIVRAAQNNRDDIIQSLVGSSPVGSRIKILRDELKKQQKLINSKQKQIEDNSIASENISSYQRSADSSAARYGRGQDMKDAKRLSKEDLSSPDQIREYFKKPNYPENGSTLIIDKESKS